MGTKTVPKPTCSPDLAPFDFLLVPKLRGDERGCDEGHWHTHKRRLRWGLPEFVVTDYLNKMGTKTVPKPTCSPDLAPFDFLLVPKLRGDERGCDEGHWHTHKRRLRWGLPEFVGTVQQVHCSWRRLLRRGLMVHVCTINKSANTKKVWKLI